MTVDMPESAPKRAAVVGCGDISGQHVAAIAELDDVELVALVETDAQRRARAEAVYGAPGYATLGELLDLGGIDVLHLCTPHNTHAPLALEALARGVHVLTEKPVAHTVAGAEALSAAAADAFVADGTQFGVCFQNRYNAPARALYDHLRSGKLGRIVAANATVMWHRTPEYYRTRPWRGTWEESGGGLLINQAIHTLDLLQWFVGPARVVQGAASRRALEGVIEVEDTADMLLEHETTNAGTVRSVFYATNTNGVDSPVTINIATEGAELTLRGGLTVRHADGRVEVIEEAAARPGARSYWGSSHGRLIADFYASLGSDVPFWIGAEEASASLQLIDDVYRRSFPHRPWA